MLSLTKLILVTIMMFMAGCSSYSKVETTILPTSNRSIDVVLHRSDVRFMDCGTQTVIQTYNVIGELIDSKGANGRALHCEVIGAGIQAGGMMGAAALIRPARTTNSNNNSNEQGQGQVQLQGQKQYQGVTTNVHQAQAQNNSNQGGGGNGGGGGGSDGGHTNHSGGGDNSNPGGHGNSGGFDNPGHSH